MIQQQTLQITDIQHLLPDENKIQRAFGIFCDAMGIDYPAEASLIICTSPQLREINKRYRGADKETDVISFPADFGIRDTQPESVEPVFLGEILIDTNYVLHQTDSEQDEMALQQVFIHGLLHLLGWDHLNYKQKENMQAMEDKILQLLKQEG
jgi:probable rRNA maturation factor